MSTGTYILGIASALFTVGVVIEMLRRRSLKERHAVWWLIAGTLALVMAVFPAILEGIATVVGVDVPVNLIFFASAAVLFLVCLQHSAELTRLEEKVRVLTEESALQELRLSQLESKHRTDHGNRAD